MSKLTKAPLRGLMLIGAVETAVQHERRATLKKLGIIANLTLERPIFATKQLHIAVWLAYAGCASSEQATS